MGDNNDDNDGDYIDVVETSIVWIWIDNLAHQMFDTTLEGGA